MSEQVLLFSGTGQVTTLYADDLPDLGTAKVERASNVEPDPDGGWFVRLTDAKPLGKHAGRLLACGVAKRADALAIEVEFLNLEVLK